MARDLLHDGHGALANERDRHCLETYAVAHDAAGGVRGAQKSAQLRYKPMSTLRMRGIRSDRLASDSRVSPTTMTRYRHNRNRISNFFTPGYFCFSTLDSSEILVSRRHCARN